MITFFNYVMDAGCIDSIACIDSDADYLESSNRGSDAGGYYYGYYYGSEQALRREKLEELIKCSYQSGTKFDQASLQLKVVVKLGDQYLSRRSALFQRVSLQITSRTASTRRYER